MEHPIPAIGRTTFLIHTIVAVAVGLPLLAARGPGDSRGDGLPRHPNAGVRVLRRQQVPAHASE